jgi:hypothetical protein
VQAPIWPVTFYSEAQRRALSSATLVDSLAGFGLADPIELKSRIRAWRQLFDLVRPELVIADFAPAAALAARHWLPLAAVGSGFANPPQGIERFPLLHDYSPPLWDETAVLTAVNHALLGVSASPLDRLSEIFRADAIAITTFPVLDPYHQYRTVPARGPFFDALPIARGPGAATIFAYLSSSGELREDVVSALVPLGRRLKLVAPRLTKSQLGAFREAGAQIPVSLPNLAQELADARLIVHVGSGGTAASALAAGVPQLVLAVDIEKELNGQALERAGVAKLLRVYDPAVRPATEMIIAMAEDDTLAARAAEVAQPHRQMLSIDPLGSFMRDCFDLLDIATPVH